MILALEMILSLPSIVNFSLLYVVLHLVMFKYEHVGFFLFQRQLKIDTLY